MSVSVPAEDLRNKLSLLLEGFHPRLDSGPPRRKPHPLYGGGTGSSSSKRRGAGPQAPSGRRSKSQPPSPTALTKPRPPRSSSAAGVLATAEASGVHSSGSAHRSLVQGQSASATSSSAKQEQLQRRLALVPEFGGTLTRRPASAPSSPVHRQWERQQQEQSQWLQQREQHLATQPQHVQTRQQQEPQQLLQQRLQDTQLQHWQQQSQSSQQQSQPLQRSQQAQQATAPSTSTSEQLVQFGLLCITSPTGTPHSSPTRLQQHPAAGGAAVAAGARCTEQSTAAAGRVAAGTEQQCSQRVALQRRCQEAQQQEQQLPPHTHTPTHCTQQQQSPCSPGAESWADSPYICCNQEGAGLAAAESPWVPPSPPLHSLQPGPRWRSSQLRQEPEQQPSPPGSPGAPAVTTATAAATVGPQPPFGSTQERRQEIAILWEMAEQAPAAWNSQDEGAVAAAASAAAAVAMSQPRQQQQQLQQQNSQAQSWEQQQWQLEQQQEQQQEQRQEQRQEPQEQWQWSSEHKGQGIESMDVDVDVDEPAASQAGHVASQDASSSHAGTAAGMSQGSQQQQNQRCQQRRHWRPYICSLTSQQLSELADPWSQGLHAQHERQGQGQEQQGQWEPPQRVNMQQQQQQLGVWQQGAHQQRQQQQRQQQQQQPPSPASYLRQQYPQRGAGVNQWALLAQPQAEQMRQQEDMRQREQDLQRMAAEDRLVADTCREPHLQRVRESFSMQRDAFACADRHNRHMPLLPPPKVVMSRVALEDLLPTATTATAGAGGSAADLGAGAGKAAAAGQQQGQGSVGGGTASSSSCGTGDRSVAAVGRGHGQGADPEARQQQPGAAGPVDFLTRFQVGALPLANSTGYNMGPLQQQQQEMAQAEQEARCYQEQQQLEARCSARQQYEAALRAMQAQHAQQPPQQQQQQQQQPGWGSHQATEAGVVPAAAAPSTEVGSGLPGRSAAAAKAVVAAEVMPEGTKRWHEEAVHTFCVERCSRSGTYYRTFTAASYPAVWAAFRGLRFEERHWYEVIREGRPAHLYFDLEFPTHFNPQADGDALVDHLLGHVAAQLRLHFGLPLDLRCVYELDSSTDSKFSRHLTVRLPGHAFATNHAMGKFVAQVVAAAGEGVMVVRGEQDGVPQRGPLVDMAVYSKNRHWRMSFCCKGGKAAVLRPTRRFATAEGATTSSVCVFLDTLVCNVHPSARLLQMPDPLPGLAGGAGVGPGRGPVAAGTVVNGGFGGGSGIRVAWKHDAFDAALPPDQLAELKLLAERALPFIERVASQRAGGAPARARTLAFCGGGGTVAYSMIGPGSHFCENVGRPHASNHVFFVADFQRGVYAQKCHDPDCARFRSGWMPLPPQLCLPEHDGGAAAAAAAVAAGGPAAAQQ